MYRSILMHSVTSLHLLLESLVAFQHGSMAFLHLMMLMPVSIGHVLQCILSYREWENSPHSRKE